MQHSGSEHRGRVLQGLPDDRLAPTLFAMLHVMDVRESAARLSVIRLADVMLRIEIITKLGN